MHSLPDEVILHVIRFLEVHDIVRFQSVSKRLLALARDNTVWKIECFNSSRAEAIRRRQQLRGAQDVRLAELRNALTALPGPGLSAWDVSQLRGGAHPRASSDPGHEVRVQRARALANWEPGYPEEKLDYYEEFVHRHAPINIGWLDFPQAQTSDKEKVGEATGVGVKYDSEEHIHHIVAPLDDGSICIWDASDRSTTTDGGRGKIVAQSQSGLLTGREPAATAESHAIMTETGAVECVAVDNATNKALFAVQNLLQEIDLQTLQLISTKKYPFPITALSEARNSIPVTIGTNWTIHLHDPRDPAFGASNQQATGELIGGSTYTHATLSQPGPLSILHESSPDSSTNSNSIWVAGRFTSLLHYDRRFFPRLRDTLHSGARIAALCTLPYPLIPQIQDLLRNPSASIAALTEAKSSPGTTLVAAAEYKGKGSLELYGLPGQEYYQNRQTASASKLLAVAPHGGKVVFSDGDGNLKWVERDGYSHVRTFNINDYIAPGEQQQQQQQDATAYGIWSSSASELPGQGDIVRKILPTQRICTSSIHPPVGTRSVSSSPGPDRRDLNSPSLLLWTGDGRLGMLGFGHEKAFEGDQGKNRKESRAEGVGESVEDRAKGDAERQFGMAMRRALERSADEVRFVRGLGMGY
ncbi:hypothetical protein LTR62_003139 [Meristemomyces frigidus]|uniref:F-box domain-containing protein n=1 Tax=Meristemomyces frigidus TaxID=1508187 RepID=A0AAN7TKJ9_9PEZI|nr:hypothetical protein LTR62_003139 [Meristemomyces frigidus]